MIEVNPLLLTGAVIGTITAFLIAAYVLVKDKKSQMGFERTMKGTKHSTISVSS